MGFSGARSTMPCMTDLRTATQDAALRLFAERGYDGTSVDDIVAATGLSRSTFFRTFGSKEAVVFADHDMLVARVEQQLHDSRGRESLSVVVDAVKVVLRHFIAEGDRAAARYALTSTVPVLRERELLSSARYQRLFREFLSQSGDGSWESELRAEVAAASVVAAHNHVLRRWLRGVVDDPESDLAEALGLVHRAHLATNQAGPAAVIVVPAEASMVAVEAAVRQAVATTSGDRRRA